MTIYEDWQTKKLYHRITDCVELEVTHKDHQVQHLNGLAGDGVHDVGVINTML